VRDLGEPKGDWVDFHYVNFFILLESFFLFILFKCRTCQPLPLCYYFVFLVTEKV